VRGYTNLEIRIRRDEVRFTINDDTFAGAPALGDELFDRLKGLRMEGPDPYGRELFQALFQHPRVMQGYQMARNAVRTQKDRFRVRLNLDLESPELHRLCWEALYDPEPPPHRLAAWSGTPLSRALDGVGTRPARATHLRVLGVVASPQGLGQGRWEQLKPIDAALEHETLDQALNGLDDRVQYDRLDDPATYHGIRERLSRGKFHVLHLVCHGAFIDDQDAEGYVVLETDDGEVQTVNDKAMAELVQELGDLQLVVLAACQSASRSNLDAFLGVAPRMISYGLPAVVAMQDEVEQESARLFTRAFYDSLARSSDTGGLVDVAVNDARERMYFRYRLLRPKTWEWVTPVVFMRGDGQLFEPIDPEGGADAERLAPPSTNTPDLASVTVIHQRRFASQSAPPPVDSIDMDWKLDAEHLLVKKYEFSATELRTLGWRLGVPRPDRGDPAVMAQDLIDATEAAGKEGQLQEMILAVLSYRGKASVDLLGAAV
jgi:CHAT domain